MSKTEHDLTSADADDALDDLFADADFDDAMNDALDAADVELDVDADDADDADDAAAELADDDDANPDDADAELEATDDPDLDDDDPTDAHDTEALDSDDELDDDDLDDDADAELQSDDDGADDDLDDGTARHGIRAATAATDDEVSSEFELPEIVPATPDATPDDIVDPAAELDTAEARDLVPAGDPVVDDDPDGDELVDDDVSDDILEELRRADIDGPVVDLAPQDDTATARRRPRRSADYDPAPMPIPAQIPRVLGRKPRVRKVTRVVRHVDPWSVFKIALVASAVLYVILLTAGVLLWNVAYATGTVDNVERFFESFGWETFTFNGGEIYHAAWIAGLFGVIGLTGLAVLAATLFNLITDLVGGMRFTVLEEEVVETRVSPMRRFVVRRAEPDVPAVLRDHSGSMIREAVVDDTGANPRPSR